MIGILRMVRTCSAACIYAAALVLGLIGPAAAGSAEGQELLRTHCSRCHHENAGQFDGISTIRKTPEGWLMTLLRMRQVHRLVLGDDVRDALMRYLSDAQGLAPSETDAGRFALEQRPNAKDLDLGTDINATCGHCHSLARVSLQRRDEEEWRKLARMHVRYWPSPEYQTSARDRPWLQIAAGAVAAQLAARYPFATAPWTQWQRRPVGDLNGSWAVVGHVPGGHDFHGTANIERVGVGDYRATYQLTDSDGMAQQGESKAVVYTGYEWRGSAEIGGRALREVYTVGPSGNRIAGRWFDADHTEDGGEWAAYRNNGKVRIVAMQPHALRTGTTTDVVIVGLGLDKQPGSLSLGEGTVVSNERRDSYSIRAQVKVADDAQPGSRNVSVGNVGGFGLLAIYRQIDQIEVEPNFAIGRLGGGNAAPVSAQFEAIGSTRLPNGALLSLGPVAADWSTAPFDAEATRSEDDKFAGQLDQRGRFLPAGAARKPARKLSGDTVDNLWVIAKTRDADHAEGRAHLIVTAQSGNTPPIY